MPSQNMITNIEVNSKGQFTRVKPRYVDVAKTVEWESSKMPQSNDHRGVPNEDEEYELCRMASGRHNVTNATILRDHVYKIKQTFEKFQTKHSLALAKQDSAETKPTDNVCKNCISKAPQPDLPESDPKYEELQDEIQRLKKQLLEKDQLIE